MKIVFPELDSNDIAREATSHFDDIKWVTARRLDEATKYVRIGLANSMISGLDYSSRDVLLAYKDHIPLKSKYFSSCFICQKGEQTLALADGGVNKQPTKEQLYTIVEDTADTFTKYTGNPPRIAMLSYSTYGSGGKNPDLDKIHFVIDEVSKQHPDWLIDGELQLDAAVNPSIASKKTPDSPLGGHANILITPDLNSGNILYKSLEQFGGFTIAGPIIQGFAVPLADLSRGSTVKDIILTIDVVKTLISRDRTRLTRSGMSEAPPVTTGGRERVPRNNDLTTSER